MKAFHPVTRGYPGDEPRRTFPIIIISSDENADQVKDAIKSTNKIGNDKVIEERLREAIGDLAEFVQIQCVG